MSDVSHSLSGTIAAAADRDLRCASRFRLEPATAFAAVRLPDGRQPNLEVHDESLFGICLVMADVRGLSIGVELEITYLSRPLRATIRHVTPTSGGAFLVGCETRPLPSGEGSPHDDGAPQC